MTELITAEALSSCGFFEGLAGPDLEELARLGAERTFVTGDQVFKQGGRGENLYVICEGKVALDRAIDLGSRRGQVPLARLGRGQAFGAWSRLLGQRHDLMTTATCLSATTLVALGANDVRQVMLEREQLGFQVMERLCLLLRDRLTNVLGALEKI